MQTQTSSRSMIFAKRNRSFTCFNSKTKWLTNSTDLFYRIYSFFAYLKESDYSKKESSTTIIISLLKAASQPITKGRSKMKKKSTFRCFNTKQGKQSCPIYYRLIKPILIPLRPNDQAYFSGSTTTLFWSSWRKYGSNKWMNLLRFSLIPLSSSRSPRQKLKNICLIAVYDGLGIINWCIRKEIWSSTCCWF